MQSAELEAWLRLGLIPRLGPVNFRKLLSEFGDPDSALGASTNMLAKVVGSGLATAIGDGPDSDLLSSTLDWISREENQLLTLADSAYPKMLLEISDPPPLLYIKGNSELLKNGALGIVGSRSATPQGISNAEAFASELSDSRFTIISGLALGIDAAAHRGGLTGRSSSIAVVGTGLDIVYPARNRKLAHELSERGLIISEFPLGTRPVAANFPRRNRLISGMSRGVLVIEAAVKSGSLITARYALEQGRDVFAVPGSIHSTLSKGCHALIKQGAKLVETAEDILIELGQQVVKGNPSSVGAQPGSNPALLDAMGFDPVDLDSICERTGLTAENASAMLLELELNGELARLPGGGFQRLR
jgi:DNA processing protein